MRFTIKDENIGAYVLPEELEAYQEDVDFMPALDKLGQLEDILEKFEIDDLKDLEERLTTYKFLANHEMSCADVNAYNLMLKDLEQYHNIEEELGIDLITYVKAHMDCVYIKQGKKIIEVDTPPITISRNNNWCLEWFYYELRQGYAKVKIKDYGKTWALTKEELL